MEMYYEDHEDAKIHVFDSCSASIGETLLGLKIFELKESGLDFEQVVIQGEQYKDGQTTYFVLDNLDTLRKNGRLTGIKSIVASTLNIKPVMKMDNNGKLISVSKVRGRKAALKAIADIYAETAIDKKDGVVFISHGDCLDDANALADMIKENSGATVQITTYVGPVIGSHSGPGTLALFFLAKER